MNKKLTFVLFMIFATISGQEILEQYPKSQAPYKGGYEAYYKDFHDIIKEKKLQPCTNLDEIYLLTLVVMPDATIQFVKDVNKKVVSNNQCAYNLARETAKYMKGWNPATINGVPQQAVARFIIYPDDLFNNFQENYYPKYTPPVYNNGRNRNSFGKDFIIKFNKARFNWYDIFVIQGEFIVDREGKVKNLAKNLLMTRSSGVEQFDKEVQNTVNILSKNFKPATINGKPIDDRFTFTITGITDPED